MCTEGIGISVLESAIYLFTQMSRPLLRKRMMRFKYTYLHVQYK